MRKLIWVAAIAGFLVVGSASAQTTKEDGKKTEVKVAKDGSTKSTSTKTKTAKKGTKSTVTTEKKTAKTDKHGAKTSTTTVEKKTTDTAAH